MEPKSSRLFFLTLRQRSYSWREGSSGNNDGCNKLFSHLSASGSQGQKSCHLIHQTSWPVNCPHQPTAAGGLKTPPQRQSDVQGGIRKLGMTSEEPISGRSEPSPEGQSPAGFLSYQVENAFSGTENLDGLDCLDTLDLYGVKMQTTFDMTTTLISTPAGYSWFKNPGRYYLKERKHPQISSYLYSKTVSAGSGDSIWTKWTLMNPAKNNLLADSSDS